MTVTREQKGIRLYGIDLFNPNNLEPIYQIY